MREVGCANQPERSPLGLRAFCWLDRAAASHRRVRAPSARPDEAVDRDALVQRA